MRHGMDITARITAHVNPGQIPVFTVDQHCVLLLKHTVDIWMDIWTVCCYDVRPPY